MSLKFSVVTVVFNGENDIEKTMNSVFEQEYLPYEYIIIDGASTDSTLEIVNSFEERFSDKGVRFVVVSEKDTGIYNAMNKGAKLATGDFVSFLNAGDWYEKDALKNINDFYSEEAFELTYGGLHYIRPDGSVIDKMSKYDKFPITSRHWNHPSMFLKTEKMKQYGFDETFRAYADFDLYLKLRKDGTKVRVIDKVIANFVSGGISTDTGIKKALKRSKEKYTAYRHNGYSPIYWIESYGWEMMKVVYFKIHS